MLGLIALLIVLGAAGLWSWRAWRVDMPKDPSKFITVWAIGTGLGLLSLIFGGGGTAWVAFLLGGLLVFLSSTSGQRGSANAVRVGETLPAFTAVDENGETFDSATLAGQRVLLKVFRGHW